MEGPENVHTLGNLRIEYRIPTWVRSVVMQRLKYDITLSSLPDNATWKFLSNNTAVLTKHGRPVAMNVYGAVMQSRLYDIGVAEKPWIRVRLWSGQDGAAAVKMFNDCEGGDPAVTATVLFEQQRQLEKDGELKCEYRCAVLDGTNEAYGREQPILNPGSVKEGDLVRLRCFLVLHAKVGMEPTYELHLETVIVAALSPDELPPVSAVDAEL